MLYNYHYKLKKFIQKPVFVRIVASNFYANKVNEAIIYNIYLTVNVFIC